MAFSCPVMPSTERNRINRAMALFWWMDILFLPSWSSFQHLVVPHSARWVSRSARSRPPQAAEQLQQHRQQAERCGAGADGAQGILAPGPRLSTGAARWLVHLADEVGGQVFFVAVVVRAAQP